jgi:hypothetical protein
VPRTCRGWSWPRRAIAFRSRGRRLRPRACRRALAHRACDAQSVKRNHTTINGRPPRKISLVDEHRKHAVRVCIQQRVCLKISSGCNDVIIVGPKFRRWKLPSAFCRRLHVTDQSSSVVVET